MKNLRRIIWNQILSRSKELAAAGFLAGGLFAISALSDQSPQKSETAFQPEAFSSCRLTSSLPYQDGEELTFKVGYSLSPMWVGAGELSLQMSEFDYHGRPAWHARADATTYRSFNRIYRVEDRYESWWDQASRQPLEFERDVNEGGFTFYRHYLHDANKGAVDTYFKRKEKEVRSRIMSLPPCSQDLLSAVYHLRSLDYRGMKTGDVIPMTLLVDAKTQQLQVRYLGREKLKTKLGTFDCLVLQPEVMAGDYFKDGEGLKVWLSNDENRLPLRAEAEILLGSLRAELKSFEGVAHPQDARVR